MIDPTGSPSEPTFWLGLEAPNHVVAMPIFLPKVAQKIKNEI